MPSRNIYISEKDSNVMDIADAMIRESEDRSLSFLIARLVREWVEGRTKKPEQSEPVLLDDVMGVM